MAKLFEIEPHVRSMIDEDGAVLLDLRAGKYYSLNGVAAQIWIKAEEGLAEVEILEHLSEVFQVESETLRRDLQGFVAGLARKGLIRGGA